MSNNYQMNSSEVDYELEPENLRKLFIGGLNYTSTEESLKSHFEQFGEIVDCVVMKDRATNRSKGFGFITFKQAHMVDDAQAARPHNIDGRDVESKRAVPREDAGKPESKVTVKTLFVGSLVDDVEENDLRDCFGKHGNIVSVRIITDKATGQKKGFCFIEFDDHDAVDKIILREHFLKGRKAKVMKALPRGEMDDMKRTNINRRGGYGGNNGPRASYNTHEFGGADYRSPGNGAGDYSSGYGGGPTRSNDYSQRSQGPYGGGYDRTGGGYGGRGAGMSPRGANYGARGGGYGANRATYDAGNAYHSTQGGGYGASGADYGAANDTGNAYHSTRGGGYGGGYGAGNNAPREDYGVRRGGYRR